MFWTSIFSLTWVLVSSALMCLHLKQRLTVATRILLVLLWTSLSCVCLTLSWSFCQKVQRCPMRVFLTRNCPLATSWTVWSMRTPTGSSQWRPTRGGWWGLAVAVVFLMTSTLLPENALSTGPSSGEFSMYLVGLGINLLHVLVQGDCASSCDGAGCWTGR